MQTGNSTAESIINSCIQSKCTNAMQFHWLCNWGVNQKQFHFFWHLGRMNWINYGTKHHPPAHPHNVIRISDALQNFVGVAYTSTTLFCRGVLYWLCSQNLIHYIHFHYCCHCHFFLVQQSPCIIIVLFPVTWQMSLYCHLVLHSLCTQALHHQILPLLMDSFLTISQ